MLQALSAFSFEFGECAELHNPRQCFAERIACRRSFFQFGETKEDRLDKESHGLNGAAHEIEWALRIRAQVNAEFDRVAKVLERTATQRSGQQRSDTYGMIAILEEKRAEVMSNPNAAYFIHDWQELHDQVRKMMMNDARYQAIKAGM
jgi:hypothetical protein